MINIQKMNFEKVCKKCHHRATTKNKMSSVMYRIDTEGNKECYKAVITCISSIQHECDFDVVYSEENIRSTVRKQVISSLKSYGYSNDLINIINEYGLDAAYSEFQVPKVLPSITLYLCTEIVLKYIYSNLKLFDISTLHYYGDTQFKMFPL